MIASSPMADICLFGHLPDGQEIQKVSLKAGGLEVGILTYGAIVQDILLDGCPHSLTLGFDTLPPYLRQSAYLGAIVGPVANRIANGSAPLQGKRLQLDKNERGKTCLHGGRHGISHLPWTIESCARNRLVLGLRLEDGHMGFPGPMEIKAIYHIAGSGLLEIELLAQSKRASFCNLASHIYFNLGGQGQILSDELQIHAKRYVPVSEDLIPLGHSASIKDTVFDFQVPKPIGTLPDLDHTFCLSEARGPLRPAACLISPDAGIRLSLATTQPGLQVYAGAFTDLIPDPLSGLGRAQKHLGIALEAQDWPDAPNHSTFPSILLEAGEIYHSVTSYQFDRL